MNKKLITKLIATMLTITLTFANVLLLGNYVAKAYATDDNLENQEVVTNNPNVEFDAYYMDVENKTAHRVTANIHAKELKMVLYTRVKKGYLKNIQVSMNSEEKNGTNFNLSNEEEDMSLIESIDTKSNTVKLKQINQDSQVIVQIPIIANKEDNFNLANFNKQNNITLEATYVNDAGKEIAINKTIKTNLEWVAEPKASLEQEVQKNKIYTINKERKLFVQTAIKTGLEDNALPIEKTTIQIQVPTIEGVKPEQVKVIATQTMATNAKTGVDFNEENWEYNKETGILGIITKNENNNNQVAWNKQQKDQYLVTYIFAEEAIQKIEAVKAEEQAEAIKVNQQAKVSISTYGSTIKEIEQEGTLDIKIAEEKGEIASSATKGSMPKFSKGYLYSKIEQETLYIIENDVQIDFAQIVDQIIINNKEDKFLVDQIEVATADYTYFKTTKISKDIFDKILGEEGFIKILDKVGNVITTINKETTIDEQNNYIYNYEGKFAEITLEVSKPLVEGELKIQHEKAMLTNTKYSNEEIASFQKFKMSANTQLKNEGQGIAYLENAIQAELIEPQTKIEAEISTSSLSTVIKNENIQIKAILLTNDDSCMLYKNPVIEMEFPNFVENIELREAPQIMYDNALRIKEYGIYTNQAGNKVLRIVVEGEDTTYNFDNISKGANIIVNADISLKKLTPTTDSTINIVVQNENGQTKVRTTANNTISSTQIGIRAAAPVGMVTTTTVTGYNAKNEAINSINAQEQTAKLDAKAQARTAKVEMEIINNYNNVAKNISILGRVPNGDTASLKTLINQTGIDASKVTIYYSTNENATKDVTAQANGWTTSIGDLSLVKSYLVVIADHEMATGTSFKLAYEVSIPENLNYNQTTKAGYTVYFDNVKVDQTIQDSAKAADIIFTTGEGPDLSTTIQADIDNGKEIQEKSDVKYTATVKNNGKTAVENVKLSVPIPEKAVYFRFDGQEGGEYGITKEYDNNLKEYSQTFDKIEPGETKTIEFFVEVQELKVVDTEYKDGILVGIPEEAYLNIKAIAKVNGYEADFASNELSNKIIQGYLQITLDTDLTVSNVVRKEGDFVGFSAEIVNVNSTEKEEAIAKVVVPEGFTYSTSNSKGKYDAGTRTILWNLKTIQPNEKINLIFELKVDNLKENEFEKILATKMKVETMEREVESNTLNIVVKKPLLTVKQTSSTPNRVLEEGIIDYNIIVENAGKGELTNLTVNDIIPSYLTYKSMQYAYGGKTYEGAVAGNTNATITLPVLKEGETLEINVKVVAGKLTGNITEKEVVHKVRVSAQGCDKVEANPITHTIIKNASIDDPSTGGDVVEGTYTISGLAWLDSNKDGKREQSEQVLENIQVMLINADNGQIVKDIKTGQEKIQNTDKEGQYAFANIPVGKYIVVYFYDTNNYATTIYQKEGVLDNVNSDAISTKVKYQGVERQAAATNTLEITNSNVSNIDIGLVTVEKFNLSLDKTITKITVSDSKGTKTYDYNNAKLAKLDLNSKYMNSANIIIEYRITVSNIGAVPGYVKKIVDYIPKDMKFNAEMNTDWYISDNGDAYNASLANTVLNPGETKEVRLVLTKKMNENNTGTINNRAEIYEASNDFAIADEDSTPGNKVSGENDMSSADAIIGVNTGEVMIYITITMISIGILAVGIYLINKKVLRRI